MKHLDPSYIAFCDQIIEEGRHEEVRLLEEEFYYRNSQSNNQKSNIQNIKENNEYNKIKNSKK